MPFLFDFRYRFSEDAVSEDVSAFINLQLGYGLNLTNEDLDGPIIKPIAGLAFTLDNGNKINVGLGVDFMRFDHLWSEPNSESGGEIYYDKYSPGLSVIVGYEF